MKIKGIIFDMDGVLIDSERPSIAGWKYAGEKMGEEIPDSLIDSFKGSNNESIKKIFDDYFKGRLDYLKAREYRTQYCYKVREKEGIVTKKGLYDLFEFCEKNNVKCAVATSTRRESAQRSLRCIGIYDKLAAVSYGDEVKNGKPAPDIFLDAAAKMGLNPEECIVVEDSINGIKAGAAGGMYVVHIPDTIIIDEETKKLTNRIVESLDKIIDILIEINFSGNRQAPHMREHKYSAFIDRVAVRDFFREYTDAYNSKDPKILLKIEHTYRVAALAEGIGWRAGFDRDLAWLSGMLHDVVRFEQVRRYHTFNDAVSVDHAKLGADLLFDESAPLINKFMDEKLQDERMMYLLETSIRNHNKFEIDEGLDEETRNYCNILRDADKIDILKVNTLFSPEDIYGVTKEELLKSNITDKVMESFLNEETVLKAYRKSAIDSLVGHISLVWGLVYPISYEITAAEGYLERMLSFKSQNEETNEKLEVIRSKIKEKMRQKYGITG